MLQKCSIWKVFGAFASGPEKSFHIRENRKFLHNKQPAHQGLI
ncbi:MAG: hypothetical protein ABIB71_03705 [Candidatus Woesearchaeota archaeon]